MVLKTKYIRFVSTCGGFWNAKIDTNALSFLLILEGVIFSKKYKYVSPMIEDMKASSAMTKTHFCLKCSTFVIKASKKQS